MEDLFGIKKELQDLKDTNRELEEDNLCHRKEISFLKTLFLEKYIKLALAEDNYCLRKDNKNLTTMIINIKERLESLNNNIQKEEMSNEA